MSFFLIAASFYTEKVLLDFLESFFLSFPWLLLK